MKLWHGSKEQALGFEKTNWSLFLEHISIGINCARSLFLNNTFCCNFINRVYLCAYVLKAYLFLLERQAYREKERQIKRSVRWFIPQVDTMAGAQLIWSQEPGASFRSPMWVQGPKALGHRLLSQATSRELEGKWSSWNMNWCPYRPCPGTPAPVATLARSWKGNGAART